MRLAQEPLTADSGLDELLSGLEPGEIVTRTLNLNNGMASVRKAGDREVLSCDQHNLSMSLAHVTSFNWFPRSRVGMHAKS